MFVVSAAPAMCPEWRQILHSERVGAEYTTQARSDASYNFLIPRMVYLIRTLSLVLSFAYYIA